MEMLIKDLAIGSPLYVLVKGEELRYLEGQVTNIGVQRVESPKVDTNLPFQPASAFIPKTVLDLTYNADGKTYTDTVDVTAYMFPTNQIGKVTLVATSVEPIIRELRASLKVSEDYLKETEKGIPNAKKRIEQCNQLIAQLDTDFAQKQQFEQRITKLEEAGKQTNTLLQQILDKLK